MITINQVIDLELEPADGTVFCRGGWHIVENRPLTDSECDYLTYNYSCDLHAIAMDMFQ
jgi:hypothetical protein